MAESKPRTRRTAKPVEAEAPKPKPKLTAAKYKTALPAEVQFSVPNAQGRDWHSSGRDAHGCLMFKIPAEDVERFERHWYVTSGRLVKVDG